MFKIKVLSENRGNCEFKAEDGLSVYVNAFGNEFLLDTGASDNFIKNAKLLNLDVDTIKTTVLTHGHSDHTNGVKYLSSKKTIIVHPSIYKKRWSIRRNVEIGFPILKEELFSKHNVIETFIPIEFYENCFFLGEIPMNIDFEKDGNFSTALDQDLTKTDYTEDDSGVAITTKKGLIIMTGCGHRGVCNTIEHAKKITGQNKVYALFGGFHLRDLMAQKTKIDKTIEHVKNNDIKELFLGHCVSDEVIEYFINNLPNVNITKLASGKEITLDL